ncbi:MAG: thioredoxin family protein [Acidimicrobiia bacterium]|nr:thioredoxin family protein [Acidimicrobiia bacterium]MDH3396999.1 thioredoxin family protein [Acidimicrobiia bacterium]
MIFKRNKRIRATRVETLEEIEELAASGRPVLIDFWQTDCQSCRTMDGIVDELANEYRDTAHVTKVDVRQVPGAVQKFAIRSTPTFVLLATSPRAKKKAKAEAGPAKITQRWRASGLVKKDAMSQLLESNGAERYVVS